MSSSSAQTQHASAKELTRFGQLKLGPVFITSCLSSSLFTPLVHYSYLRFLVVLAMVSLVTGYFSENRPPTKKRQFYYTLLREVPARLTLRKPTFPTTDEQYAILCKEHGLVTCSETLEAGITVAHWIGPSSAEDIIIYFPGGGYVLPAMDSHFNIMFQMQQMLSKAGKYVAVLFLSYVSEDLAPVAQVSKAAPTKLLYC
ncbi:hypothetical protein V8E51_017105 [Hyaloscypha variabilis]